LQFEIRKGESQKVGANSISVLQQSAEKPRHVMELLDKSETKDVA
jgi:hypothetical protein